MEPIKQGESKEAEKGAKLLNASQAAFELGITKAAVARLREQGKLPGVRGRWGRWFYHPDAVAAVIIKTLSHEQQAQPRPQSLGGIIGEITPPVRNEDDDEDTGREQAPLIRMANAVLVQAIESGASDIHLEPDSRYIAVRFRIDGILHDIMKIPNHITGPLIQRYKIMADINILERRVPQAGNIPIKHVDIEYDLRASTLPSRYGENMILHILRGSDRYKGFSQLGMHSDEHYNTERLLLDHPSGLIVVAGPGGSGITTTAYNVLHRINSITQKIVTLEALPEYHLGGVTQTYYHGRSRSSFSETLRLLPLMDVDTLFLGDINTPEARSGAVEAALSGKRVIATMAADNAVMALWRLSQREVLDDHKESFRQSRVQPLSYSHSERPGLPLQETLLGVLAQRLVRCVCSNCREPYTVSADELSRFGFEVERLNQQVTLVRGKGCDVCRGSGYRARLGIYELITMNSEIAELVVRRAPLADIKDAAKAHGMKELREQGLAMILSGQTTPEEVLRVLGDPQNIRP